MLEISLAGGISVNCVVTGLVLACSLLFRTHNRDFQRSMICNHRGHTRSFYSIREAVPFHQSIFLLSVMSTHPDRLPLG